MDEHTKWLARHFPSLLLSYQTVAVRDAAAAAGAAAVQRAQQLAIDVQAEAALRLENARRAEAERRWRERLAKAEAQREARERRAAIHREAVEAHVANLRRQLDRRDRMQAARPELVRPVVMVAEATPEELAGGRTPAEEWVSIEAGQ